MKITKFSKLTFSFFLLSTPIIFGNFIKHDTYSLNINRSESKQNYNNYNTTCEYQNGDLPELGTIKIDLDEAEFLSNEKINSAFSVNIDDIEYYYNEKGLYIEGIKVRMNSCYIVNEIPSSIYIWFDQYYQNGEYFDSTRFWLENRSKGDYDNEWIFSGNAENFSSKYRYVFSKVNVNSETIYNGSPTGSGTGAGSYYLESPSKPAYDEETVGLVETPPAGYKPLEINTNVENGMTSGKVAANSDYSTINTITYDKMYVWQANSDIELYFTYKEENETSYKNEWEEVNVLDIYKRPGSSDLLTIEIYSPDFKKGTTYDIVVSTEIINDLDHSPVPYYTITGTTDDGDGLEIWDKTTQSRECFYPEVSIGYSFKKYSTDNADKFYEDSNQKSLNGFDIYYGTNYIYPSEFENSVYAPKISFNGENGDYITPDWAQTNDFGAFQVMMYRDEMDWSTTDYIYIADNIWLKSFDTKLPVEPFYIHQNFPELELLNVTDTTATFKMPSEDDLWIDHSANFIYEGFYPSNRIKGEIDPELNSIVFTITGLEPNTEYIDDRIYWFVDDTTGYEDGEALRLPLEDFKTLPSNASGSSSMSTGAIIGIAVGSTIGLSGLAYLVYYLKKTKDVTKHIE